MRLISILSGASLALLAAPALAADERPASLYLEGIAKGNSMASQVLLIYTDAFNWANVELKRNGQPMIYCPPGNLGLHHEQVGAILKDWVEAHPEDGKYDVGMVLLDAMKATFPCA